ncbi:MAG: hypothetical protein FJ265_05680 [Planctomycetes bacterium]|nr:hypothetical protein [Planctomycetota bacterium]
MPRTAPPALAALALAALLAPARAQDSALGADEAKLRWVDGRPMLRATLRAGDKVYYCHLLLDLATTRGLFLHRNAAGTLQAEQCDVEAGGIVLAGLPFEQRRDTWLEGLTAQFAEPLQQVPVAGILGLPAFGARDVILDGPNAVLKLRPPTPASAEPPPASSSLCAVPFAGDFGRGLRVPCSLGEGLDANLALHTRDPFSWLDPELCRKAGHPDGVLATAAAGEFLDFARWTPFRPLRSESGGPGGIGGAVLQQLVLHVQPEAARIVFGMPGPPVYPEVEAEFQRAAFGRPDAAGLQQFLARHGDTVQAPEAAALLLERLLEQGGGLEDLQQAGLAVVRAAAKNKKGTAALDVLDKLPGTREAFGLRAAIAEAGLAEARADEDGNAAHKLRLELGTQKRLLGDMAEARRHLLSAVFGMPVAGAPNLQLGHWHRARGELDAALGRYFLAMLDMRDFGQPGYAAFAETFRQQRGAGADLIAELEDRADGRVPSFQPIPREPASVVKTGRTVLVELFTGAMCPPCVAADAACDGLLRLYDRDEVLVVQWHLPVPAPEPLVAPASLRRAEARGVRSTPTVVIAGGEPIAGGGRADAAPDLFRRYREVVDQGLAEPPALAIEGEARRQGRTLHVDATVTPAAGRAPDRWRLHAVLLEQKVVFPGANGMLFHRAVARATLTPAQGAPVAAGRRIELAIDLAEVAQELDALVRSFETEREFLVRPVQPGPELLEVAVFVQDGSGAVLQSRLLPVRVEAGR